MKVLFLSLVLVLTNLATGWAATLTVTSTNDDGPGSLRQAIAEAAPRDTVAFDLPPDAVIGLTSAELFIDKSLILNGPGAGALTIEVLDGGSDGLRVLEIAEGIYDVVISGLTIAHGRLFEGGSGLFNHSIGAVELRDCVITENTAYFGGGAANDGTLTLTNCTVSKNTAGSFGSDGGGICNTGMLTVTGSTISENESGLGGGLFNSGVLIMTNSTVSENFSQDSLSFGGGIRNEGSAALSSCTISGNSTGLYGGGIDSTERATLRIRNTIVAGNTATGPDIYGQAISEGYNLIGNNSKTMIMRTTGDQIGTPEAPIDPLLGPLQDNGGPTPTQALLTGSPAIDQGGPVEGVMTDQRGRFRPVDAVMIAPAEGGDNSDIGAFEVQAARPLNVSTRANVLTGENILDAGFILVGNDPKQVLVRGLGPSLGVPAGSGRLADPVLELRNAAGTLVMRNDNWRGTQRDEIKATGLPPRNPKESALVATLAPGAYTALLSGKNGGTGVGLVEVYDLETGAISTLANTSTRGFVGTEDNVMITGFILGAGEGPRDRVIVRALGPSLQGAGVNQPLADPALELHDENGALLASDDDWQDTQRAEIAATGLAPTNRKESAIVQALPAGAYTAIVRGMDRASGVALLEVYDLH